jgi:hypothetical protein
MPSSRPWREGERLAAGVKRFGFRVLAIGWLLFLLEPLSSTGLGFPFFFLVFGITVFVGVVSFFVAVTRRPLNPLSLLAWLVHPLAACALLVLFLDSQTPVNPLFRLRFHLSQDALEDAALRALSARPVTTPAWVGLFPVRRVDVFPPEVHLLSDGCGVVDECGLAYRPGPVPPGRSKTRLKHLGGPWYHLYSVF